MRVFTIQLKMRRNAGFVLDRLRPAKLYIERCSNRTYYQIAFKPYPHGSAVARLAPASCLCMAALVGIFEPSNLFVSQIMNTQREDSRQFFVHLN